MEAYEASSVLQRYPLDSDAQTESTSLAEIPASRIVWGQLQQINVDTSLLGTKFSLVEVHRRKSRENLATDKGTCPESSGGQTVF